MTGRSERFATLRPEHRRSRTSSPEPTVPVPRSLRSPVRKTCGELSPTPHADAPEAGVVPRGAGARRGVAFGGASIRCRPARAALERVVRAPRGRWAVVGAERVGLLLLQAVCAGQAGLVLVLASERRAGARR